MKNILTIIAVSIFALFFSSQIIASGYSGETESGEATGFMAEAIKHAEMAKAHKANAKKIHQHAKKSLDYVIKAEKETIEKGNTKEAPHITASIKHLVEAIDHAKIGHGDIAIEHIDDALVEMIQFTAK